MTSERRMNSCRLRVSGLDEGMVKARYRTHLSHVTADLADLSQELDRGHPFICAQACLARKVVHMCDETFEQVLQAWVGTSRVDHVHIFGDVVDCEVLKRRDVYFRRIHGGADLRRITVGVVRGCLPKSVLSW